MNRRDTIEVLQLEVKIPDVVQKKATQAFDEIRGHKVEAKDKVIPYNRQQSKPVYKFPKKRIGMIAAIATLVLATVSVAAAYLNWSKSLSEGLQITPQQQVQMEENSMTTFVNQSCTDQGITVTAVQSITDNYYTHIVFKVEGYEPEKGAQPGFEDVKITVDGKDDFNSGGRFYDGLVQGANGQAEYADGTPYDLDKGDNYVMDDGSLEFFITLANSGEKGYFINKPIHVEITNLGTLSKAEYFNEIDATWSFDWDLQGSQDMKECTLNVPLGDTDATVVKAEISPISLRVEYQFSRQEITDIGMEEDGEEVSYISYAEPPQLSGVKMKDGTLYPFIYLGPGSLGYLSEDSDLYLSAFAIDRVIEVDQVEGLLFVKSYPEDEQPVTEANFYVVPIE